MKRCRDVHKELEKAFSKNHAGYVLITCENPNEDGSMKVEMTYGGSTALAHVLINGAFSFLDDQAFDEVEVSPSSDSKIRLIKS